MDPIRALIVDDEPAARAGIRHLLERDPDIVVVGECRDGREAVAALTADPPDLLFLDVQMPELDGFEVLRAVGTERVPVVVFVTAYDWYALRAFEVHALDYLLKPFDDARFHDALARAKEAVRQGRLGEIGRRLAALIEPVRGDAPPRASESEFLKRIAVKAAGRVTLVTVRDIDWIEAEGDYVRLHVGKTWHLIRDTMKHLEARLEPARFVRIHRSTIVNIERVKELHPYFKGDHAVVLHDGTELRLSRGYRDHLEARLGARL